MQQITLQLPTLDQVKRMNRRTLINLAQLIGFKPIVPRKSTFRIGYIYRLSNWYKQYKTHYNQLKESGKLEVMQQWYNENPKAGYYYNKIR